MVGTLDCSLALVAVDEVDHGPIEPCAVPHEGSVAEFAAKRADPSPAQRVRDGTPIDLLCGAIYYRLLLRKRPLDPEQIDAALALASPSEGPR